MATELKHSNTRSVLPRQGGQAALGYGVREHRLEQKWCQRWGLPLHALEQLGGLGDPHGVPLIAAAVDAGDQCGLRRDWRERATASVALLHVQHVVRAQRLHAERGHQPRGNERDVVRAEALEQLPVAGAAAQPHHPEASPRCEILEEWR